MEPIVLTEAERKLLGARKLDFDKCREAIAFQATADTILALRGVGAGWQFSADLSALIPPATPAGMNLTDPPEQ